LLQSWYTRDSWSVCRLCIPSLTSTHPSKWLNLDWDREMSYHSNRSDGPATISTRLDSLGTNWSAPHSCFLSITPSFSARSRNSTFVDILPLHFIWCTFPSRNDNSEFMDSTTKPKYSTLCDGFKFDISQFITNSNFWKIHNIVFRSVTNFVLLWLSIKMSSR
jgi:hypothetical protein